MLATRKRSTTVAVRMRAELVQRDVLGLHRRHDATSSPRPLAGSKALNEDGPSPADCGLGPLTAVPSLQSPYRRREAPLVAG